MLSHLKVPFSRSESKPYMQPGADCFSVNKKNFRYIITMNDLFDLLPDPGFDNPGTNYHEEMVKFKTYLGTLQGSPNGTLHIQDIFYYLYRINHLSDWEMIRDYELEMAEDIEQAFEYFLEQEWYEEAQRLKKAMKYMFDYLERNHNDEDK